MAREQCLCQVISLQRKSSKDNLKKHTSFGSRKYITRERRHFPTDGLKNKLLIQKKQAYQQHYCLHERCSETLAFNFIVQSKTRNHLLRNFQGNAPLQHVRAPPHIQSHSTINIIPTKLKSFFNGHDQTRKFHLHSIYKLCQFSQKNILSQNVYKCGKCHRNLAVPRAPKLVFKFDLSRRWRKPLQQNHLQNLKRFSRDTNCPIGFPVKTKLFQLIFVFFFS